LQEIFAMPVNSRVVNLLLRYEELREAGRSPTPEELCAGCPELLDEVRRRLGHIAALDRHLGDTPSEAAPAADLDTWTGEAQAALSFRLVRFHARGGLGEVHLAQDAALRRRVALKRLRPEYAGRPDSRQRFLREAEVTARLEHPGVVPVYGLVEGEGGQPCYAMRFIEGESLKDAIDRFHRMTPPRGRARGERGLALRELLGRFVAVCNTVAYAHSRGILHRDLKPANVMLGKYGETLVVDWGLARPVARSAEDRTGGEETLLPTAEEDGQGTRTGQALGTPAYMSPEQAAGDWDVVGPPSDVYGLGAVLYCLLTGQPPFTGQDVKEVLRRVRADEFPRPAHVKPGVPRSLEAVCLKAMAREPQKRYAGALELAAEVERWLADEPVRAYREPLATRLGRWMRQRRALVTSIAAVLLVSVASLAVTAAVLAGKNRELTEANTRERAAKEEAKRSFAMARDAVDECYSLTSDHRLLQGNNMQPVRKLLFDVALKYYQGFIDGRPGDPQTRAELARNFYRVASINEQIASKDKALAALQQALRIRKALAERSADPSLRIDLAETYSFLGFLQASTGQKRAAEESYGEALRTWQALRQDGAPRVRYGLASTLIRLGDFRYQNTDHRGALGRYEEALVLLRRLLRENPRETKYKSDTAKVLHNVALTHRLLTGNLDKAERYYQQAIALQKELVTAYPAVPAYSQALATTYTNLGILHFRERHNRAEALRWYTKALEIQERLVESNPAVTHYQQSLANAHGNLGNFYRQGMLGKAREHFEKCLRGYEELSRANPSDTNFQVHLAMTYANLGELHAETGHRQDGLKYLRDGLRILEKVVADDPAKFWPRNMLGTTLGEMAKVLADLGRYAEALKAYRGAVAQHKTLVRTLPEVGEYRSRLSGHYQELAALQRQLRDHAAAVETLLERRKLWPHEPAELFTLARELVSCVLLVDQRKAALTPKEKAQREKYADLAMETLRQAVANGYKDADHLKKDKDLDPLRSLSDFPKLLAELEQKKTNARKK
jgi:serine/threonine-protein kinase